MKQIPGFYLVIFMISSPIFGQSTDVKSIFQWPNGAKAAVCLTYDDGLDSHLDEALPDLDKFGFKGTFYCTGYSQSLKDRPEDWKNLTKNGHELGNHSLFHPCIKEKKGRAVLDWVKPEYDLARYTMEQIYNELELANTLLSAIDGKVFRTYAYTCSDSEVGGSSFVNKIRPLFPAARCDGPLPENMKEVDLYLMPSWGVNEPTGQALIDYVKKAGEKGTIATIMFHSVGGGYLNVSRKAHLELVQFLAEHPQTYWVDTFMAVTEHIKKEKKRLGW